MFSRVDKVGSKNFCLIFFAVAVVRWVLGALPFSLISGRYSAASHFICNLSLKLFLVHPSTQHLAMQHDMWYLSSLTRDWAHAPCNGSTWPLDYHKSPVLLLIDHLSSFTCFYIKEMFCLSSFILYVQYLCVCMHFIMWLAFCVHFCCCSLLCVKEGFYFFVVVVCFYMLIFV